MIRSDSSWAFSMIRSPSELIRLAARTSSGTAARSSSISPSAAFWSTTTLFVSGSFLPFASSDSRRSTRKMMSIGPALRYDVRGKLAAGGDYRTGFRVPKCSPSARSAGGGTSADTSPPNVAISFARLELT